MTGSQFVLRHRGKTLRVCRWILNLLKYQRSSGPASEIYFVCCSICSMCICHAAWRVFFRLLLQVPRASQVMKFLWLFPRHDLASSRPLSSRGFLEKCPFSKPPNLPFRTAKINNIIAIGFLIVQIYKYKKIAFAFIWPLKSPCHLGSFCRHAKISDYVQIKIGLNWKV